MSKDDKKPVGYGWARNVVGHTPFSSKSSGKLESPEHSRKNIPTPIVICLSVLTLCTIGLFLNKNVNIKVENGSWKFESNIFEPTTNDSIQK